MPATNLIEPALTKVTGDCAPLVRRQSASEPPTRIDALVQRVRATYVERIGLALTVEEAQRLWQLGQTECEALLTAFVDAGFLRRTRGGVFTRSESRTAAVWQDHLFADGLKEMSTRTVPQDKDIVIRQEQREGTIMYVLHTAPGPDQYELRSRDEAVAQAVTVAKREHVRAWLTDESYDFVLLEDFRAVESV
jgi:hypothetical protein